jgi:hypothetical protein
MDTHIAQDTFDPQLLCVARTATAAYGERYGAGTGPRVTGRLRRSERVTARPEIFEIFPGWQREESHKQTGGRLGVPGGGRLATEKQRFSSFLASFTSSHTN